MLVRSEREPLRIDSYISWILWVALHAVAASVVFWKLKGKHVRTTRQCSRLVYLNGLR